MSDYLHLHAVLKCDYSVYLPPDHKIYSGDHHINCFHQCGTGVMREIDGVTWFEDGAKSAFVAARRCHKQRYL